ncbi:NRPS-like enzyme [Penicillium malachiteum]|uniref:NRPS-like enzyme n=1 Tax=Penicillium malachiteum TaxID=1324776 RepID=UPI00254814C2|nr:NRPS-like enzyme [Penicillium malachiteum]KAJ5731173.1 NRPS-like enzyme [Penicillium malachiteum]
MNSVTFENRLLTQTFDSQASRSPSSLFCIQGSNDGKSDWHQITVQEFANAVNRLAWWIDQKTNGERKQQVLAYIGTNDLRYGAFILACMKTGHVALLLSTRNSQQAQRHLLKATGCSVLVDGSEKIQLRRAIDDLEMMCSDMPLIRWQMDSLKEVFISDQVANYPHNVKFTDVEDLPAILIHSSGTTGHPKPITVTHGYLATMDNLQNLPLPSGRQSSLFCHSRKGDLRFLYTPMFHFMGIICLIDSIFFESPFLFAPDSPLTSNLFSQIMSLSHPPTWGVFTPWTLEGLVASEEGVEALKKLSGIIYAGAPMAESTGNKLFSITRIQTILASSETSYTPGLLCEDPADWGYHEWIPAFDLRMEDVGDGLWELVLPKPATRRYHGIFHSHPHLEEYHTGDLFRPHPSKPGLWRYDGRRDDIIVLSNGEKFNPIEAEKLIEAHPLIGSAAIFGQDRFQAALLIQPNWEQVSSWTLELLRHSIWPAVENANRFLPSHAKIFESHIVFASQDKPFQLSPKGTLRRRDIFKDYSAILDKLYDQNSVTAQPTTRENEVVGTGLLEIQQWIQRQAAQILRLKTIDQDSDLSVLGMDSLQVLQLAQALERAEREIFQLQKSSNWTSAQIYNLFSIPQLAQALFTHIHGRKPELNEERASQAVWSREDNLIKLIWEQKQLLGPSELIVAITGTTGELGSYLLHGLLQDPSISRIFCLNRSDGAAERQILSFEKKGLSTTWLTEMSRVQFWTCSLEKENLGLSPEKYHFLKENVEIVLHNAWTVNFNQPVTFFEPQIVGVRRLLTLIGQSSHRAHFHFVSSVSAVLGDSATSDTTIPETLHDATRTLHQGYGESKFVAEHLCGIASEQNLNGSRISIHRVGQLGGPSTPAGIWNTRDWFPSLIRSSRTMRKIPSGLGSLYVDWLPIDVAARAMTEIIQSRRQKDRPDFMVYHITNPNVVEWGDLVDPVARACNANIVPLAEWVQELESLVANQTANLDDIPAAGLLDYFRFLVHKQDSPKLKLSVRNSQMESPTLRSVGSVDEKLMSTWLRQWKEWIPLAE